MSMTRALEISIQAVSPLTLASSAAACTFLAASSTAVMGSGAPGGFGGGPGLDQPT